MFEYLLIASLTLLAISTVGFLYRVVKGPSLSDRVVALDTIGINLVATVAVYSVLTETLAYFEIILLIGIMGFVGTIAFSKFIERGVVIERKRNS